MLIVQFLQYNKIYVEHDIMFAIQAFRQPCLSVIPGRRITAHNSTKLISFQRVSSSDTNGSKNVSPTTNLKDDSTAQNLVGYAFTAVSARVDVSTESLYQPHIYPEKSLDGPSVDPADHPSGQASLGYCGSVEPLVLLHSQKHRCFDHGCNGREFTTGSNLLRHKREKSGTSSKPTCHRCGAEFTRKTARDGHLQQDKCERPDSAIEARRSKGFSEKELLKVAFKKESRTVRGEFDELVTLEQKSDHDLSRNERAQPRLLNIHGMCRLRPSQIEGFVEFNPAPVDSKVERPADHIDAAEVASSNMFNDSGYGSIVKSLDNIQSKTFRPESPPVETDWKLSSLFLDRVNPFSHSIGYAKSLQDPCEESSDENDRDHYIDELFGGLNTKNHHFSTGDLSRSAMSIAKHQLVVKLMRDVYTRFNWRWQPELRAHAADQPTPPPSQHANYKSAQAKGKRKIQDRGSPPPEGNDGERQGKRPNSLGSGNEHTLFACPFHKFDPRKYCSSSRKYHTCAGPGFASISRLR